MVGGSPFVAPAQHVNVGAGRDAGVLVVSFSADPLIDVGVVFVFGAGHAHVGHGAAGGVGQDGVAYPGGGFVAHGDPLG